MVLVSLLIAGTTTFSGGSVNDFVTSVAATTGKNVIAAVAKDEVVPPFSYDPASLQSLHDALSNTPLHTVGNKDVALSDGLYVGTHFLPLAPDLPEGAKAKDKFEKPVLKDGKVTIDTSTWGLVHMDALSSVKWSKPMSAAYLMHDLSLSIHVKDMPELEFLQLLANAIGSSLGLGDHQYRFVYNDEALRANVRKTLMQQNEDDHPTKRAAKRHLLIALVDTISQPGIGFCLKKDTMELYPWIAADNYNELVSAYINDLRAADKFPGELTEHEEKVLNAFLSDKNQALVSPQDGQFEYNADGISAISFPLPYLIPGGYHQRMPAESI